MNQQELQQFITPYEIVRGVVLEGDKIEFEIKNTSPFPFMAFEQSCGCLGLAELGDWSFKGAFNASLAGTQSSTFMYLKVGENRYAQMQHTPKGPWFYDPIKKEQIPNEEIPENPEKVPVANFYQTITLWLDDGEDIYRIGPNKQLETNPNKNRIIIPIRFLMIKKPS